MLGPGRGIGWLNRLGLRLAALLSIALLPLGLIAFLQTMRVTDEAGERAAAALRGQTVEAAEREKELIQTAIGAARAFGAVAHEIRDDPGTCAELFGRFVAEAEDVVFAGYIDGEGHMRCTSAQVSMNFAGSPLFRDIAGNPRLVVRLNPRGPISDLPVVIVTVPVTDAQGRFDGAVSISVEHGPDAAGERRGGDGDIQPFELVTFNAAGELLTASLGIDSVGARLPRGIALADLARSRDAAFRATSGDGRDFVYSVVPIIDDAVYAIASWTPSTVPGQLGFYPIPTLVVPVLMWLASLAVAYFAVHRLVIRHIRDLRHRIRVFTSSRRRLADGGDSGAPAELREVTEAFDAMTRRILADEADLEASLQEKNVLLREVHHRVKNNLQLITSMIGMQMRRTDSEETKRLLKRLQNRVYGLAVIHQNLYHASALSRVRADALVEEIVHNMLVRALGPGSGVRVNYDLDPVALYPDQALPLALLSNEAVTNALKHLGRPKDGLPWIEVRLWTEEDGRIALCVENSCGARVAEANDTEIGTGLGRQLIQAFLTQLGGEMDIAETQASYRLDVRFEVAEFEDPSVSDAGK